MRLYSIGSAPAEESLKFFVKLVPGGQASQYFGGLKGGEEVKIGVAMGRFTVPPSFVGLTMIATGVGAAPFFGFIKDQLDFKKSAKKFRLIFGVRSEEDLFWQEELEAYRKKYNNFTYTITLSQPKNPDSWTGSFGRVTGHLEGLDADHDFYVCGSPAMVMDVRKILLENKINTKKIHLEAF